jgi:RNA polymerase-binding protein DksA
MGDEGVEGQQEEIRGTPRSAGFVGAFFALPYEKSKKNMLPHIAARGLTAAEALVPMGGNGRRFKFQPEKQAMGPRDQEAYRKRLVEMRDRLIQAVDTSEQTLRANLAANGDSTLPTHPADLAVEGLDEENAIAAAEEHLLDEVQDALERIVAGTFGQCQDCGQDIALERLEALPQAAYCIDCAMKREQNQ